MKRSDLPLHRSHVVLDLRSQPVVQDLGGDRTFGWNPDIDTIMSFVEVYWSLEHASISESGSSDLGGV